MKKMKTLKEIAAIKTMFDNMSEEEQWKWLVSTDAKPDFIVSLDNDTTDIFFTDDTEADYMMIFKADIGAREGVFYVLRCLGVNAEYV